MPRDRLCLAVECGPAVDRQRWAVGTAPARLFAIAGAGAAWSPRSRDKTARGYGRWLTWLPAAGLLDPGSLPEHRVTKERVGAYLAELKATCAPFTLLCRVQELYDALRALAPRSDWKWLKQLMLTLSARAIPTRDKRSRLRGAGELFALGMRLMAEAHPAVGSAGAAVANAERYRDGLAIALLAHRPKRMRNFAAIRLGEHLIQIAGQYWLLFDAPETKTRRRRDETVFPQALVSA